MVRLVAETGGLPLVSMRPGTEEPLEGFLSSLRGLARLLQHCSSVRLNQLPWSSMAPSSARVLTSLGLSHHPPLGLRSFRSAPKRREGGGKPGEQLAAEMGSLGCPSQRSNLPQEVGSSIRLGEMIVPLLFMRPFQAVPSGWAVGHSGCPTAKAREQEVKHPS